MGLPVDLVLIYLLGGLTFLPTILGLILLHAYLTFPILPSPPISPESTTRILSAPGDDGQNIKNVDAVGDFEEKFRRRHESDVAAGYFAVCREYVPGGVDGKPPERSTPAGVVVASESPSIYQSMYKSLFDRKQGPPSLDPGRGNGKAFKRARNVFFVVLRHGHLMLYDNSEQLEVKHVISLELHDVGIFGGEKQIPEGELWIRKNAIRLLRKPGVQDPTSTSKPFFFFSENCSDKEDFYFALLQNQEYKADASDNPPRPQQYETNDIVGLVQKLHSSEEHFQTRWINALIGRLFLALYKTREAEDFIRKKITKKIARVKKPAFLSDIDLQKIDLGNSAPHITNPKLKDLTIDGDCCAEADFKYSGNFRLEIAATARIDLGARFKAREVNLVLAVVVKKLNGHGLVKFKPAPSNRVWISFETMPDMEMTIEPIVSSRHVTYGIILRAIESRIREVMAETVVLPNWDDIPFTDTIHQRFRGGVWADYRSASQSISEHARIPDEAPEDELDVGTDLAMHAPQRTRNGRLTSVSGFVDGPSSSPTSKIAVLSSQEVIDLPGEGASTAVQKRVEPPKALRSRSFASAANPLLSMDNANFESPLTELKSKQQQDATSAMMAISGRSRPTSPTDLPSELASGPPPLWDSSKDASGRSSIALSTIESTEWASERDLLEHASSYASLPAAPTSTNSLSTASASGIDGLHARHFGLRTPLSTGSNKKQTIAVIGAATAAAKSWGWGVLNRNVNQKDQKTLDPDRAGTPSHPIGRGRPLPPPGQPLPFPNGPRSKMTQAPTSMKKSVPPSLPQRPWEEGNTRPNSTPPNSARKRQDSTALDRVKDADILIVEAPPVSEPSSPNEDRCMEFPDDQDSRLNYNEVASAASTLETTSPDRPDPVLSLIESAQHENASEKDKIYLSSGESDASKF